MVKSLIIDFEESGLIHWRGTYSVSRSPWKGRIQFFRNLSIPFINCLVTVAITLRQKMLFKNSIQHVVITPVKKIIGRRYWAELVIMSSRLQTKCQNYRKMNWFHTRFHQFAMYSCGVYIVRVVENRIQSVPLGGEETYYLCKVESIYLSQDLVFMHITWGQRNPISSFHFKITRYHNAISCLVNNDVKKEFQHFCR